MAERRDPIALFDSGVGGLTVAQAIKAQLPAERLVYFGDTARVPYGPKSADTVRRYSRENALRLRQYHPKIMVVACNTSSAYALDEVAQVFPGPVVGVIKPGARAAIGATRSKRVGVLGTRGTIASGAYQAALAELDPRLRVFPCACGLFVPIVEEQLDQHPVARLMVEHYLDPLLTQGVDTLILGCTHYPLLGPMIAGVVGAEVTLVSSALETAREVQRVLSAQSLLAGQSGSELDLFLMSDDAPAFRRFHQQIFNSAPAQFENLPW